MKSKLRYVLCILAISIFSPIFTVCNAESTPEHNSAEILNSLGIIKGEIADIKLDDRLSRASAALWISNLLGNTEEYSYSVFEDVSTGTKTSDAIMGLYKMGIIAGYGNKFRPNDTITQNEFYSMLCNAIGYSEIVKLYGGYPSGAIRIMSELGVNRGVGAAPDGLTLGKAACLIVNTLNSNALETEFKGNSISYRKSNKSIMNELLDLYLVKGWVEANSRTSLYKADGGKANSITIDEETYFAKINNADDLLGLYVEAYVHIDFDDSGTVVAAVCQDGMYKEISVNARDIKDSSTRTKVVYNENNTTITKNISVTADIIYNGVAYPDATIDEIYPNCGEIRLIDRNGDNVFDIVFVTSYSPVIADGVDQIAGKIINKYTGSGFESVIDISKEDKVKMIDTFGELIELSDITENAVVFINKPKTGDTSRYEIVVSQKPLKGQVSSVDLQEGICVVGDAEYKISGTAERAIKNGCQTPLKSGKQYTLYFDIYDEVIFYEIGEDVKEYGYIYKIRSEKREDYYYVDMLCEDGEWRKIRLREKIKCDDSTVTAEEFFDSATLNEIVKYELNDKGELKSIEYPILTSVNDPNYRTYTKQKRFTKVNIVSTDSDRQRWYINTKAIGGKYYTPNIEYRFFVPSDGDKNNFSVSKFSPKEDYNYNLSMYDIDEFGYGKVVMEAGTAASSVSYHSTDSFMIVEKTYTAYVDEEEVSVLSGFMNGQKMSFTGEDKTVFTGLNKGDIIRVKYPDGGNKVAKIERVIVSSGSADNSPATVINGWIKDKISGTNVTDKSIYRGKVSKVDYAGGRIGMLNMVYDSAADVYCDITWRAVTDTMFNVYDSVNEEAKSGSINDIVAGDDILIRHHGGKLEEVLILK